jgi:cytochrome c peroxidase
MRAVLLWLLALSLPAWSLDFSKAEVAKILQHGPWPPALKPHPGNAVSGKPAAIAFGEKLFFEPRLSGSGSVLCASCHVPFRHFQDARARAFGLQETDRNTPTLIDSRFYPRYGWDGARDSLWAQSIRPLLDVREMRASPAHVANTVRQLFSRDYETVFARAIPQNDDEVLLDVGKALAAFQETLVSRRTPFDDFRDALERGETRTGYSVTARRGLKVFVGTGNCSACHSGAQFSNGEVIEKFRVPGLRAVAQTAPYLHDGRFATLDEVLKFHSPQLGDEDRADLASFLESLSAPGMVRTDHGAP